MFRSHFLDYLQGARGQYFVKLPSLNLLIYVCYRNVRFAAVCHYNPSVYVCVWCSLLSETLSWSLV